MRMSVLRAVALAAALLVPLAAGCTRDVGGEAEPVAPQPPPSASGSAAPPSASPTDVVDPGVAEDVAALSGTLQVRLVEDVVVDPEGLAEIEVDCSADPRPAVETPAAEGGAACDAAGLTYVLAPAAFEGGVASAETQLVDDIGWRVAVQLDGDAAVAFAQLTGEAAEAGQQVALVLGGRVLSAPSVQGPITDGELQISGSYSEPFATALAAALEAGG